MEMSKVNERAVVLDILLENEKNPGHSHICIRQALTKYQYLDKRERAFIGRLSNGTLERQLELDYIINQFSKIGTAKMKPVIRNILRMAVYQLRYMQNVPVSAACNESVKLANKRGFSALSGFVNGVLRNISRNLDKIEYPDRNSDYVKYMSVRHSMPEWIVSHFINEFGKDILEDVMSGFEKNRVTYIRCNTRRISPDDLRQRLTEKGIKVSDTSVGYAFAIDGYDFLADIDEFNEGLFQIQDLSSIMEGLCIHPHEGDFIVDVCAAPGGKCLHAAQMSSNIKVQARDVSEMKLELIQDNIERMQADNVTVRLWDATVTDSEIEGSVDIMIADVPCSGLGIMGRKPDIRYNITPKQCDELADLQRRILAACSGYVKAGGYIIYSTCTINKKENIDNVTWFTDNYPYHLVSIRDDYRMLDKDTLDEGYVQLLPGIDGTDGFFIAKLQRNED